MRSPAEESRPTANRKLIRPQLTHHALPSAGRRERRRVAPPEDTGLEAAHFLKQRNLGTPLVFTLESGEVLRGTLEWHDKECVKLRRSDGPSLVIMKQAIVHWCRDERVPAPPDGRRGAEARGSR